MISFQLGQLGVNGRRKEAQRVTGRRKAAAGWQRVKPSPVYTEEQTAHNQLGGIMSEYGYRGPSIDHSLLSPSGRCSKRARAAAEKREAARLFPPGYWDTPAPTAEAKQQAERLRRTAQTLRDLAARGMKRRKYTAEASKLEAEANQLETTTRRTNVSK